MRNSTTFLLVVLLAVGIVACDSGGERGGTAQVRLMHASPDAGEVDVFVAGNEIVSDVDFDGTLTDPTVSDYEEVRVGNNPTFELRDEAGNPLVSFEAVERSVQPDQRYTIVVVGANTSDTSPQAVVLLDQIQQGLPEGVVGLRLVHGSALAQADFPQGLRIYQAAPGADLSTVDPLVNDFQFTENFPRRFSGQFGSLDVSEGREISFTPSGGTSPVLFRLPFGASQEISVSGGVFITGVAIDSLDANPSVDALVHIESP